MIGPNRIVAILLVASALLLGVMVPGGPVETRSFAHISPWVLGLFNTFLTALGLLSLPLGYVLFTSGRRLFGYAASFGAAYLAVYALDLLKIFPVSPDPMPPLLMALEVTGSLLSIPLVLVACRLALHPEGGDESQRKPAPSPARRLPLIVLLLLLGAGIIAFATYSAMGR